MFHWLRYQDGAVGLWLQAILLAKRKKIMESPDKDSIISSFSDQCVDAYLKIYALNFFLLSQF